MMMVMIYNIYNILIDRWRQATYAHSPHTLASPLLALKPRTNILYSVHTPKKHNPKRNHKRHAKSSSP